MVRASVETCGHVLSCYVEEWTYRLTLKPGRQERATIACAVHKFPLARRDGPPNPRRKAHCPTECVKFFALLVQLQSARAPGHAINQILHSSSSGCSGCGPAATAEGNVHEQPAALTVPAERIALMERCTLHRQHLCTCDTAVSTAYGSTHTTQRNAQYAMNSHQPQLCRQHATLRADASEEPCAPHHLVVAPLSPTSSAHNNVELR